MEPFVIRNVLGGRLQECSQDPLTGFYRDGLCHTGPDDRGRHVVCAQMTEAFLLFSKSHGNDLTTPLPMYGFPGLVAGDRWCLCALRWLEAQEAGMAPQVFLQSTNQAVLRHIALEILLPYRLD